MRLPKVLPVAHRGAVATGSLLLCLTGTGAHAQGCPDTDPEAMRWLDRMSRSAHHADYQGVVTLQRGDEMRVMQLSHNVGDGTASEHLTQLTGQGARVDRTAHPLDCVHPGHQLLRMSDELQAGRCGVAEHYRFTVAQGERVAGRKAVRILVEPRDLYRYGYVMELDRETGLLLKVRTVGRGGKVLERFQFAKLSYQQDTPDGAEVELVHEAAHPHPGAAPEDTVPTRDWSVNWLPGGFMPTDAALANASRRSYTDGLAVFSVFLEELGTEIRPGEGVVRQGGTLSYTRGMPIDGAPVLITVIGEVPVNTARMVADHIGWSR